MLDSAQRSKVPQRHQQQSTTTISTPAPPPEIDFDIVPPSPTPSDSSSRTLSPPPPRRHLNLASSTGTSNTLSTTPTLAPFSGTPTANAPSSLQTPPTTTKKPNPQIKKRQKVALAPGCSPLDWARVKSSGDPALRAGYGMPIRVTVDELKKVCVCSFCPVFLGGRPVWLGICCVARRRQPIRGFHTNDFCNPPFSLLLWQHNTTTDAWSAFNGKVYNITPYLRFHPGGEKELMRCAGRDGTKLFSTSSSSLSPIVSHWFPAAVVEPSLCV
jgi:hypothetical protein